MHFEYAYYLEIAKHWAAASGVRLLLIVLLSFVAIVFLRILTNRFRDFYLRRENDIEKEKRLDTLSHIIRNIGVILIAVVAVMTALSEFGVDLKPIIAAAGIGGIAIGFGAQSLVKDVIGGFFILLENQIRVGDIVEVGASTGLVEKVGLRVLVLRDFAGKVHIVPNGMIDKVINHTKDFSRYVFDIGVAYREDVDAVMALMREVGADLQSDPQFGALITVPFEVLGLDRFADSAMIIKARITTKPGEQWAVAREYNRRLKIAFDRAGVEIPYPHQTLYFGEDKEKQAPPLRVALRRVGNDESK